MTTRIAATMRHLTASDSVEDRTIWAQRLNHWTVRWSLLVVLLVAFTAYRFAVMGANAAPPGSDGGNWLAFGRELMGEDVKAARAVYPPIAPLLSWLLANLIGPLEAGKLMATVSGALSGIAFYLIASTGAPWGLSLLGTAAFLASGYRSEVVAFGGYPQLIAEAFALGALWLFAVGTTRARWSAVAVAAVLTSLVVGTHHLTSIFLLVALAVCSLALVAHGTPGGRVLRMLLGLGLGATVLSSPYAATYYSLVRELAGSPFNAQGWAIATAGDTFSYVFRNSVGLWYALLGVAGLSLVLPAPRQKSVLRTATISLLLPAFLLFTATGEVRFLQFLLPGIMLGVVMAAATLWESQAARSGAHRALLAAMMLCVVGGVGWGGVQFTRQAFPWYQVIDKPRLEALDWLRSNTVESALVATTATRNGLVLGWWIEGYAGRKMFSGGNPAWMFFRQEKEQTQAANGVFELLKAGDPDVREAATREGISYLVIDKEYWMLPRLPEGLRKAFENDAILIIEIPWSSSRGPVLAGHVSLRV